MNRIGYYIREGVDSIFAHSLISFTTICVILACLLIMGSFACVALNVNHVIGILEDQVSLLAFVDEKTVLITGLTNPHVIRTSEMLDLKCLVFVRGKVPTEDILDSAEEQGLVVITTKMTAFSACGLLYDLGLRGVPVPLSWGAEDK